MLQRLRDRISGWIAGMVIALVGGAFILFGIEFYFEQGAAHQGDVATVNGVSLTQQELNHLFSQMQRQVMMQSGGHALSSAEDQQLKSYALQSLITQTALLTTLQKDGFHVGLTQVKAMVEQTPAFQDQGQFSQSKFLQAMYNLSISPMQFFQQLQTNWIVEQATNGVADAAFTLPDEVNHYYSLIHQKRAFGYLIIPMQSFLSKTHVLEKDISDYYKQHQKTYQTQPKVSVAYLMLSPQAIAKTVQISNEEVKAYFDSHTPSQIAAAKKPSFVAEKNNIVKLLQRQRVNQILSDKSNQLSDLTYTNPGSLAAASKELNLPIQVTPMMTKTGEQIGIFSNPKVLEAIFSDSVYQSGNNSNPIVLQNGDQIVLRVAKKNLSQPIPLKTVHDQIQKTLQAQQAEAQVGLLAYQLQKKITDGNNPTTLAKQYGLQWHTVSLISAHQKSSTPNAIVSAAFTTPVSSQKGNWLGSQAVLFHQKDYAVIVVSKIENADSKNLSAADQHQIASQLSAMWGQLYQHAFVDSIVKQSKVVGVGR